MLAVAAVSEAVCYSRERSHCRRQTCSTGAKETESGDEVM